MLLLFVGYLPRVVLMCVGFFRVLINLKEIGETAGWLAARQSLVLQLGLLLSKAWEYQ